MVFLSEINEVTLLHFFLEDALQVAPYPKDAFYIQDGNALFHTPTNLSPTCGEISLKMLGQMNSYDEFQFFDRFITEPTQSRLVADCIVVSLSGMLQTGQQQQKPSASIYSWQIIKIKCSYVICYFGCEGAKQQHHV